ncbi:hypothetical protein TNCV_4860861 [Trichonephila clavipes]|nr:hypothetical protein TNCV_4860861 [Trichonephila clavipes]
MVDRSYGPDSLAWQIMRTIMHDFLLIRIKQNFMMCLGKETFILSVEELDSRISVAVGRIREIPEILRNTMNFLQCHCQTFQMTCGNNFELVL